MKQWKIDLIKICENAVVRKGRLTIKEFQDEYGKGKVNRFITRWFIQKYLGWNRAEVCEKLTKKVFRDNGLGGFLVHQYDDCLYKAMNEAFPGKYLPWNFRSTPNSFWNRETAIEAIKWWIEKEMQWKKKDICTKFTKSQMLKNPPYGGKIYWLVKRIFNGEVFCALEAVYPGKFKEKKGKIVLNQ